MAPTGTKKKSKDKESVPEDGGSSNQQQQRDIVTSLSPNSSTISKKSDNESNLAKQRSKSASKVTKIIAFALVRGTYDVD